MHNVTAPQPIHPSIILAERIHLIVNGRVAHLLKIYLMYPPFFKVLVLYSYFINRTN